MLCTRCPSRVPGVACVADRAQPAGQQKFAFSPFHENLIMRPDRRSVSGARSHERKNHDRVFCCCALPPPMRPKQLCILRIARWCIRSTPVPPQSAIPPCCALPIVAWPMPGLLLPVPWALCIPRSAIRFCRYCYKGKWGRFRKRKKSYVKPDPSQMPAASGTA